VWWRRKRTDERAEEVEMSDEELFVKASQILSDRALPAPMRAVAAMWMLEYEKRN
jgi:hypothetical protein